MGQGLQSEQLVDARKAFGVAKEGPNFGIEGTHVIYYRIEIASNLKLALDVFAHPQEPLEPISKFEQPEARPIKHLHNLLILPFVILSALRLILIDTAHPPIDRTLQILLGLRHDAFRLHRLSDLALQPVNFFYE